MATFYLWARCWLTCAARIGSLRHCCSSSRSRRAKPRSRCPRRCCCASCAAASDRWREILRRPVGALGAAARGRRVPAVQPALFRPRRLRLRRARPRGQPAHPGRRHFLPGAAPDLAARLQHRPGAAHAHRWTPALAFQLLLASLLALGVLNLRAGPWIAFGVLWFFLQLAPTNSIVPRLDVANDRQLYLASWGLFLALCIQLRNLPVVAFSTVLAFFAVTSILRQLDYRSEIALWESSVAPRRGMRAAQQPRLRVPARGTHRGGAPGNTRPRSSWIRRTAKRG